MAVLNIRNLPDPVHARLRLRAAANRRSMEAEAREILTLACAEAEPSVSGEDLQRLVKTLYGASRPKNVVEELLRERRRQALEE